MSRKTITEIVVIVVLLVLATTLIAKTNADIIISSYFYIDGAWPVGDMLPWNLLYKMDRIPSIGLALAGLLLAGRSFARSSDQYWRKSGLFLALFLIIGPGLIVNTGFKDGWGRPRPRDINQFGGKKEFHHPWQIGQRGQGRSFPSGHTSAAVFMAAPFFIYRRKNTRLARYWLTGGIIFGLLMSTARIAQGAHFLSDNLWAFGMVWLTGLILSDIMKLGREPQDIESSDTNSGKDCHA